MFKVSLTDVIKSIKMLYEIYLSVKKSAKAQGIFIGIIWSFVVFVLISSLVLIDLISMKVDIDGLITQNTIKFQTIEDLKERVKALEENVSLADCHETVGNLKTYIRFEICPRDRETSTVVQFENSYKAIEDVTGKHVEPIDN